MFYVLTALALWLFLPRLVRKYLAWKKQTPAERSTAIRFASFSVVLTVIVVIAMLYLPHKERALAILPVFVLGATLARWWQNARERLRRQAEQDANFAQARRIN